jgi:hypothetical protein
MLDEKDVEIEGLRDAKKTHDALRELCRQRGTPLEEQSSCGEDMVLWAGSVMDGLQARVEELEAKYAASRDHHDMYHAD